jgi:hypothetical protein
MAAQHIKNPYPNDVTPFPTTSESYTRTWHGLEVVASTNAISSPRCVDMRNLINVAFLIFAFAEYCAISMAVFSLNFVWSPYQLCFLVPGVVLAYLVVKRYREGRSELDRRRLMIVGGALVVAFNLILDVLFQMFGLIGERIPK